MTSGPKTTEVRTNCPHCGRRNELHTGRPGRTPADGSIALCWGCRKPGVYIAGPLGLGVRLPTLEETEEILSDPQVRAALAAMTESYDPVTASELWAGDTG